MKIERCKDCEQYPELLPQPDYIKTDKCSYMIKCKCNAGFGPDFESLINAWNQFSKIVEEEPVNEDCLFQYILVSNDNENWEKAILLVEYVERYQPFEVRQSWNHFNIKYGFPFPGCFKYAKRIPGKVYKKPELGE